MPASPTSVFVATNGCEEACLTAKRVERFFRANGLAPASSPQDADLNLFYACGLTQEKEDDSIARIEKLRGLTAPHGRLVVWGCLPMVNPERLARVHPGATLGPREEKAFEHLLPEVKVPFSDVVARTFHRASPHVNWKIAELFSEFAHRSLFGSPLARGPICHVRIATGCLGHCTFCTERLIWGKVQSREPAEISEEVRGGLAAGYRRFMLLAGDLGAYGADNGTSLSELMDLLLREHQGLGIRLLLPQINPRDLRRMLPDLGRSFASGHVEMLGCPVQSGSDRLLRRMGRGYTAADWRDLMLEMNRVYPGVRLKSQLMVGFPGETEEDFQATVHLLDPPLRLLGVKTFRFSVRPSIPAAKLPDRVCEATKTDRARRLARASLGSFARSCLLTIRRRAGGVRPA